MGEEVHRRHERTFVVDTSFLIDCEGHRYWTLEPLAALRLPNSEVVIPTGVGREYYLLSNGGNGRSEDGNQQTGYDKAVDLLNLRSAFTYESPLRKTLADKLDQEVGLGPKKHKALSHTDKTIVQATMDLAMDGDSVAVLSADWAIVYEVRKLSDEKNLDVSVYSPWRVPSKQDGIELLLSGQVFDNLPRIQANDSNTYHLAVARGMNIGGEVRQDIAFRIYKKGFASNTPRINDVYYVRLFNLSNLSYEGNSGDLTPAMVADVLTILGCGVFAVYASDIPSQVLVLKQTERLLDPLRRQRYMAVLQRRSQSLEDLRGLSSFMEHLGDIDPLKHFQNVHWARIEDDDIKRHDKLTVGILGSLRGQLERQR